MQIWLIKLLCCPYCKSELELVDGEETLNGVEAGHLLCLHCNKEFPIIDGIPVFIEKSDKPELEMRDSLAKEHLDLDNEQWLHIVSKHHCIPLYERHCKSFVSCFSKDDVIVDLGIGYGWYWKPYLEDYKLIGVDFSFESLRLARNYLGPSIELICANATNLVFRREYLDGIWSCQALQHIQSYELMQHSLYQIYESLKSGGIFELRWLNYASVIKWLKRLLGKEYPREFQSGDLFLRRFRADELRGLLAEFFDPRSIEIRYEENLFHVGYLTHKNSLLAHIDAWLENKSIARLIARQLSLRVVK